MTSHLTWFCSVPSPPVSFQLAMADKLVGKDQVEPGVQVWKNTFSLRNESEIQSVCNPFCQSLIDDLWRSSGHGILSTKVLGHEVLICFPPAQVVHDVALTRTAGGNDNDFQPVSGWSFMIYSHIQVWRQTGYTLYRVYSWKQIFLSHLLTKSTQMLNEVWPLMPWRFLVATSILSSSCWIGCLMPASHRHRWFYLWSHRWSGDHTCDHNHFHIGFQDFSFQGSFCETCQQPALGRTSSSVASWFSLSFLSSLISCLSSWSVILIVILLLIFVYFILDSSCTHHLTLSLPLLQDWLHCSHCFRPCTGDTVLQLTMEILQFITKKLCRAFSLLLQDPSGR